MSDPPFNLDMGKMSDPAFRDSMFSQVNGMMKLAKDKLMCDPACQFQRKSEELKRKLDKAGKVKIDIPSIYKRREKDYYVFTKGVPYYDNMMEERYEATARQLVQKMFKKHREQMKVLREELHSYASGTLYEQNIRDLWVKYQNESDFLSKLISYSAYQPILETHNMANLFEICQEFLEVIVNNPNVEYQVK
mgnify:CR=1 FL=1